MNQKKIMALSWLFRPQPAAVNAKEIQPNMLEIDVNLAHEEANEGPFGN